jgi:hypothetical protein
MIATTTRSSISVKPFLFFSILIIRIPPEVEKISFGHIISLLKSNF